VFVRGFDRVFVTDQLKKIRAVLMQRSHAGLLNSVRHWPDIGHVKSGAKYRPGARRRCCGGWQRNRGPLPQQAVSHLYTEIMSACRALEDGISVAYLGPQGTFSEERH
jgi:hypothetical protein